MFLPAERFRLRSNSRNTSDKARCEGPAPECRHHRTLQRETAPMSRRMVCAFASNDISPRGANRKSCDPVRQLVRCPMKTVVRDTRLSPPSRLRSIKILGIGAVLAPIGLFAGYGAVSYQAAFDTAKSRAVHLTSILQEHAQRTFEAISLALSNTDAHLADVTDESIKRDPGVWNSVRRVQRAAPNSAPSLSSAPTAPAC